MLELALVEILTICCLQILFPRMPDQGERNEEEDESATDASCVGYELLRILLEDYNNDDWNRDYDAPDSLDDATVVLFDSINNINLYLEKEFADFIVAACEPLLDGNHFHQVVSQSYRQNWHRGDIQHWVEIADLTYKWQVNEVLIEKISNLAGEHVCGAFVWEATECEPC